MAKAFHRNKLFAVRLPAINVRINVGQIVILQNDALHILLWGDGSKEGCKGSVLFPKLFIKTARRRSNSEFQPKARHHPRPASRNTACLSGAICGIHSRRHI